MFVNNYIHNIHVVQLYNRYCGFAQSCFIALMGFNVTSIGHHLFRLICAPVWCPMLSGVQPLGAMLIGIGQLWISDEIEILGT